MINAVQEKQSRVRDRVVGTAVGYEVAREGPSDIMATLFRVQSRKQTTLGFQRARI